MGHDGTLSPQMGEDQEALKAVQSVLKWDPNNIKALFRRGKVGEMDGNLYVYFMVAYVSASIK